MKSNSLMRLALTLVAFSSLLAANADIPLGYYAPLQGKKGAELKTAIHELVAKAPYVKMLKYGSGANSTWWAFYSTDRIEENNQVIDRYSNAEFYYGERGESVEGMDIEHSFPKSYWGGTITNAYKDLYNLLPCEASINRCKSNYAMGLVDPEKNLPTAVENGLTKVGKGLNDPSNNYWEPGDPWKGDFARGYMYMATAYQDYEWVLDAAKLILETGDYPTLRPEASALYIQWAKNDPVARMETVRVDSVMRIQGNRNPYVDFPNLMEYVWGDSIEYAFDVLTTVKSAPVFGSLDEPYVPETPGFNPDENDDSPLVPDGVGSEASPLNVTQVIARNPQGTSNPPAENADQWVEGYIVGWMLSGKQYVNTETTSFVDLDSEPCDNAASLILGPQAYTSDYKACIIVQLPNGAVRSALNLVDNPGNHHRRVAVRGDLLQYYKFPSVRNTDAYKWVNAAVDPVDPDPNDPVDPVDPDPNDPEQPEPGTELTIYECDFTKDAGNFTVENVLLPDELSAIWTRNSTQGWIAIGYTGTSTNVTQRFDAQADLVSPMLDLKYVENTSVSFSEGAYKASADAVQQNLHIYARIVNGPEVELTPSAWPKGSNQNWVDDVTIDLSDLDGMRIYLVFRYTSNTTDAPYWKIRNLRVNGRAMVGVETIDADDANLPAEYFSIDGRRVDPATHKGIVIRRQGSSATKLILK